MTTWKHWTTALVLTTAFAICFVIAGCETTERDMGITITPSAIVVGDNASISLTASQATEDQTLLLPLDWWVSNPELGTIVASSGYTAVYVSKGVAGVNIIGVRDQRNAKGVASITQEEEEEEEEETSTE